MLHRKRNGKGVNYWYHTIPVVGATTTKEISTSTIISFHNLNTTP
ncbi:MAG: hypothetical protein ABJA70_22995 [Chryseolinea sp.]